MVFFTCYMIPNENQLYNLNLNKYLSILYIGEISFSILFSLFQNNMDKKKRIV